MKVSVPRLAGSFLCIIISQIGPLVPPLSALTAHRRAMRSAPTSVRAAGGPRPLGLAGLALGFGISAALVFLIVDCEASMFGLQVLGCESPRLLTPAQSPTSLGLNILCVAAGYLAIATLALFALAASLHAAHAALAGAPSGRRLEKDGKSK